MSQSKVMLLALFSSAIHHQTNVHVCQSVGASTIGPFEAVVLWHSLSPHVCGKRQLEGEEVLVFK